MKNKKKQKDDVEIEINDINVEVEVEPCKECEERKKKMNKVFPFTKTERETIKEEDVQFISNIGKKLTLEERILLGEIYDKVYGTKTRHCNCPQMYKQMIDKLIIQIEYQNV